MFWYPKDKNIFWDGKPKTKLPFKYSTLSFLRKFIEDPLARCKVENLWYPEHDKMLYVRVVVPLKGILKWWKFSNLALWICLFFWLLSTLKQSTLLKMWSWPQHFNLLQSEISMHILQTVFYTFHQVLTRRICLMIKSFFSWWSFPLFSWLNSLILGWCCKERLDASLL